MSNLLKQVNQQNHSFSVKDAEKYGVIPAVILNNLRYWLMHNKVNGINLKEGRYWTYNSVKAFEQLFPYLSTRQVRTAIDKLIESKIVVVGIFNKYRFDKTRWFSINEDWAYHEEGDCENRNEESEEQVSHIEESKLTNSFDETRKTHDEVDSTLVNQVNSFDSFDNTIPDINNKYKTTNINKEIKEIHVDKQSLSVESHCDRVLNLWNASVEKHNNILQKARTLSNARKARIKKLSKTLFKSLEEWHAYFESFYDQKFLLGANSSAWRADFDFALNENKAISIIEKKYIKNESVNQHATWENPYA